jgi:hypothetical protein
MMTSRSERTALAVRDDVMRRTRGQPLHWVMVHDIAEHLGLDDDVLQVAIRHAIDEGWIGGEGEPVRSVCLPPDPLQQLS